MPFGKEPVACESDLVIGRGRIIRAVKILFVFRNDRSKFFKIEKCVSRFYRLECPLDELYSELERPATLGPFQTGSDTCSLEPSVDRGHMRIEGFFAAEKRGNTEDKADQIIVRKCTHDKSSRILCDDKMSHRRDLDLR